MKTLFTIFILILVNSVATAEWALESEAPYVIVDSIDEVTIDKDGNHETITTSELRAQNEQGRNQLIQQTVPFVPDAESIEFIKGSSTTDGIETSVNPKRISIRGVKGLDQGITHVKEMVIPFNNLKIGSTIKYTVKTKSKKSLIKGLFQRTYIIGLHAPELSGRVKIKSALPLNISSVDAWDVIKSKKANEGGFYFYEYEQTKPVFKQPRDPYALLDFNNTSRVDISTLLMWNGLAKPLAEKYEKILANKKLPLPFAKIVTKASKATSPVEKINIVTSELANIMTYRGTWTSLEKMYVASPLAQIAKTKTGDCKDFSIATTAMLRALGMTADVALVARTPLDGAPRVGPIVQGMSINPRAFNHAIVKVKDGEKIYWVDPTNIVSDAAYINSDIAGSKSLVISATSHQPETIPVASAEQTHLSFTKKIKFNADGTADTTTEFETTGEFSKSIMEASFAKSESTAKKAMRVLLRTDAENESSMYEGINFRNRITAKITGKQKTVGEELVNWHDKKLYLNTGFSVPILTLMGLRSNERVSAAFVPSLFSESTKTFVEGYDFVGFPEECVVLTPWFNIQRSIFKDEKGFRIEENISFHKSTIYSDEINTEKFKHMVSQIPDCAENSLVQVQPLDPTYSFANRLKDYTTAKALDEYNKSGPESITGARNAYHIVNQILERNPEDKDALVLKARSIRRVRYISSRVSNEEYLDASENIVAELFAKHPEDPAVLQQRTWNAYFRGDKANISALFAHAFKVSPKDFDIYNLGGSVLHLLGQKQAAIGSHTKALATARNAREKSGAASNLGDLLLETNQIDNGIAYHKYAIKLDPEDAWMAGNLAAKIQEYGKWDEAISIGEDVVRRKPYGMAKYSLASAYAGKARSILTQKTNNPLDETKNSLLAEGFFSKGLSHSPGNEECLTGLAKIYGQRAEVDKNPMTAQKSLRYIEKALKGDYVDRKNMEALQQNMANIAQGKTSERLPAATIPTTASTSQTAVTQTASSPPTSPPPATPAGGK